MTAAAARQLVLESAPDAIYAVEREVEEIRRELDFRDDVFANVMVAVTEAVNNAAIHGNALAPDKRVHVEFITRTAYCLVVRVRDEGPGFDPDSLPDPTAAENLEKLSGRGVFLMRQLADECNFSDEGRCVELVFNI